MVDIVIIDDESELLDITVMLLKKKKYTSRPFNDGYKALEYLQKNPCRLILVDLSMPDINGIEIITKLRENSKNLPIIAMSGMDWNETLLESALIVGANKILKKPFISSDLYSLVEELLNPD